MWMLNSCSYNCALGISFGYWTFVYPHDVKYGNVTTAVDLEFCMFQHAANSVLCLLDVMVSRKPIRIGHVVYPFTFGWTYEVLTLIYWSAGGLTRCHITDRPNATSDEYHLLIQDGADWIICDRYLYPFLIWDKPLIPFIYGVTASGMVVASQLFFIGLGKFRNKIHGMIFKDQDCLNENLTLTKKYVNICH